MKKSQVNSSQSLSMLSGQCMCGEVVFSITVKDDSSENVDPHNSMVADACHCMQCRQWSGHFWASVNVPIMKFQLAKDDGLSWFRVSDYARRGFCQKCGSSLFWHADGDEVKKDEIAVALGSLENPTGIRLVKHIFVAEKGDGYDLVDGLPTFKGSS